MAAVVTAHVEPPIEPMMDDLLPSSMMIVPVGRPPQVTFPPEGRCELFEQRVMSRMRAD